MGILLNNNYIDKEIDFDYVVASKFPSGSDDETGWYRLYKSGWIEQGGISKGTSGTKNIIFAIPYNEPPIILVTPQTSGLIAGDGNAFDYCSVQNVTGDSFDLNKSNTSVRWVSYGQTNVTAETL